jgi:hypothetical protein
VVSSQILACEEVVSSNKFDRVKDIGGDIFKKYSLSGRPSGEGEVSYVCHNKIPPRRKEGVAMSQEISSKESYVTRIYTQ